ncbi:hypothetical protein V6N13_126976 [Hibiscus sabdariffa]|uniref:Uncharacterized protein n=1 Tax=Hibiscus sabdariffa TaxID=183260 RepID=A0ABR2RDU8_9ROSI
MWQITLQPNSKIWQFNTKGKHALRNPIAPKERHDCQYGVVEKVEEGQLPGPENGEDRTEHVEKTGEVKDVGPEEDAAGGTGSEGETEEPLEWGLRTAPEPSGLIDFRGSREEDPGEDYGRDDAHDEAMQRRDGAEGDGSAASDEEAQKEVDEGGDDEVKDDGGDEEGPGGAP